MSKPPSLPLRRVLIVCALLVALVGIAALSLSLWKAQVDRDLDAAWRQALGGPSFLERYPKCDDNATVRELEALGASIGIDMAPAEAKGRVRPAPAAARRFAAIKTPLKNLLDYGAQSEDGAFAAPPAIVAEYLDFARPTLHRVVELLLHDPPPVWQRDLGRGFEITLPNLVGVLQLQKLLLLEARERIRNGHIEDALGVLEASWRYIEAVRRNGPSLIHQLIAIAMLRQQQPVLRSLPAFAASAAWRARLQGVDPRACILIGLHAEAFVSYHASTLDQPLGSQGDVLTDSFWMRFLIWDYARRFEAMLQDLVRSDMRSFDPEAFYREQEKRLPRWQLVARIMLPNFWDVWGKVAHTELSADLTARILEERERLASGSPRGVADRRPSRVQGLFWIYEETPEGTRIHLDGALAYQDPKPMPTRFLVRRPISGSSRSS